MVLFVSESDVAAAFTMSDCIKTVEDAFSLYARGGSVLLPRMTQNLPGGPGALRTMSAFLPQSSYFGLKTLTGIPGRRLPGETYFTILLFEGITGALRSVISANHLTGLRTGAASGVAAKYLAREDVETLGVFGAGAQARYQVEALCAVRPVQLVRIYTPRHDRAVAFAQSIEKDLGIEAAAVATPREAVRGCGLVATATTSTEPVFDGEWLEDGTHVSGAGSNNAAKRELDHTCFRRSRVVVDFREQAIHEAGDLRSALDAGALDASGSIAELGALVAGSEPGRTSQEQITLFKSVGIAIEDIASAAFVYERALSLGLGTELEPHASIIGAVKQ